MVLEVATLKVKEGFTRGVRGEINCPRYSLLLLSMKGYLTHQLKKCIEI